MHGFPKVMGVLTHLDGFKDNKRLKKTKKALKHRFWTEIYQGRWGEGGGEPAAGFQVFWRAGGGAVHMAKLGVLKGCLIVHASPPTPIPSSLLLQAPSCST